jgi:hypothetical protein
MESMMVFLRMRWPHMSRDLWWLLPLVFIGVVIAEFVNDRKARNKETLK